MIELQGKYTNAKIFADTIDDGVISQVYDIINCKAFENQKVVCMPDVHVGASGPCGLVATIGDYVCPEHIGVDIGCSVSMMILDKKIPSEKYAEFEHTIKESIPFGFNINENVMIDDNFYLFLTLQFERYRRYWPEMLAGLPDSVDARWVSEQLKRIGMSEEVFYKSLGTVGGGNHFIEYDELVDGSLAGITLHFGSRHFGVKVCGYWTKKASEHLTREEVREITDRLKKDYISQGRDMTTFGDELKEVLKNSRGEKIPGYLSGDNLKGYLCDMCFAQLYAQYNHMVVQGTIRNILMTYGIKDISIITSVHNFIDLKDHTLRKSAIRSYEGEEILVPFNMRDGVAVCVGLSNHDWLNSCAHGAGRKMSRSMAKEKVSLEEFQVSMKEVYSTTVNEATIDESPMAYKDTTEIRDLIQETCKVRYMMIPKINIKDDTNKPKTNKNESKENL